MDPVAEFAKKLHIQGHEADLRSLLANPVPDPGFITFIYDHLPALSPVSIILPWDGVTVRHVDPDQIVKQFIARVPEAVISTIFNGIKECFIQFVASKISDRVPKIYDFSKFTDPVTGQNRFCVAMARVGTRTLNQILAGKATITMDEMAPYFRQILEILITLGDTIGFAHRDLSLNNVIVDEATDTVYLIDFEFSCMTIGGLHVACSDKLPHGNCNKKQDVGFLFYYFRYFYWARCDAALQAFLDAVLPPQLLEHLAVIYHARRAVQPRFRPFNAAYNFTGTLYDDFNLTPQAVLALIPAPAINNAVAALLQFGQGRSTKHNNRMQPLKVRLRGGGYQLNAATRAAYFWRCQQIYCSKAANATFSDNIRQNMGIVFDATQKVLDDAAIDAASKAALNAKLARIKGEDKGATLTTLNIKTLQCVILMTEICRLTNPGNSTMAKYPVPSIKEEYAVLVFRGLWDDYDHIYNLIKNGGSPQRPGSLRTYKTLIGKSYPAMDYCCPDLSGARILVLLGEMTLLELVDTMADNIYLIGVTTEIEWADGNKYTPFEFVHHDLIHAANREYGFGNYRMDMLPLERAFIDHVKANPGTYDLDKLMIPMFLLMHEKPRGEGFLTRAHIYELDYRSIKDSFVGDLENWHNPNFYGGLLPAEVREGSGEGSDEERKRKRDEGIIAYLNECFAYLKDSWNSFHAAAAAAAAAGGAGAGGAGAGKGGRRTKPRRKSKRTWRRSTGHPGTLKVRRHKRVR
jgi:hypothetical protein